MPTDVATIMNHVIIKDNIPASVSLSKSAGSVEVSEKITEYCKILVHVKFLPIRIKHVYEIYI